MLVVVFLQQASSICGKMGRKTILIETERCTIQPFEKEDSSDTKKLFVHPEVRKFLGGIREETYIQESLNRMINPCENEFYWVVREKTTKNLIGLVSLDPHHDGDFLEVSYQFLPKWWGKGYASEGVQRVLQYAFTDLKQEKIVAETQTANERSCRLLERVGMQLEHKVIRFGAEQAIYSMKA